MIHKHERFLNDIKRFNAAIDKMTNEEDKSETRALVNSLVKAVKNLDNMHLEMIYGKQTALATELRENITEIRKSIEKKIKTQTATTNG